jgi:hypothetical protein
MSLAFAKRCTSATQASPILPNAADDGIGNPRCLHKKVADHPDRLQLGDIALQEDPVDRAAGERHVLAQ